MSGVENLKKEIERERKALDEMLDATTMEDVLVQSRKVDRLLEEYIRLTQ